MNALWKDDAGPRLILGTVQLGMPYGIANVSGMPDRAHTRGIIETALSNGITYFDTAHAYGDSEMILGSTLSGLGVLNEVRIISKLSPWLDLPPASEIEAAIEETFRRLRVDRLWCLLLHEPKILPAWESGLGEVLRRYRDKGRIEHLGISLRTVNDAKPALQHPEMEFIQAPCNAWDRRMVENGHLAEARRAGKRCYIRSIYLQGLLTMAPETVAEKLPVAHDASVRWWRLANDFGVPPRELAMRYALTLGTPLIVGVESVAQLEDTVRMTRLKPLTPEEIGLIADAMNPLLHRDILEPGRWPAD